MLTDDTPVIAVLLVEDDEDDYVITRHLLSESKTIRFQLDWAESFSKAEAGLAERPPDVVLLDLTLPDSHGWKTLVRMLRAAPRLPVILLTGSRDEALGVKAVQEGAQDYLFKGYLDCEGLTRAIRYAIERKRAELAFKEYQEHLEEMVQERTTELRRANQELTEQIQHRIRIERDIEDSRNYLQAIVAGSHDGIALVDEHGCFEFGNDAFTETLGWPRDELIGQHVTKVFPDNILTSVPLPWSEEQPDEGSSRETDVVAKDGQRRSLLVSHRLITVDSHPKYCVAMKDITARKRAETELRRAIEQLKAHDKAKTQFVSNVSHELKTPLASMTYAIDNMLKGIVGEVSERLRAYLHMLRSDAERLGRAIGDILDMSRLEANALALDRVVLPFGRFVRHIVDALRLQAEEKRQELRVAIDGCGGFVDCDPQKMERVVMNIIRNAVKFTPEQGVIEVAVARADGGALMLSVTDTGIGIPLEHLDHVTERYFRVGEYVDGTGLGLAIAKEIVVLHGGTLTLRSPPPGRDRGTQVDVALPAVDAPTIMTVDGSADVRDILSRQLGGVGYRVVPCASASEALERIAHEAPSLIMTDLVMSGMSGVEVIAAIRSNHDWRRIPMVAMTGAELDRARREILEGLNIPALVKPWSLDALIECVENSVVGDRYPMHQAGMPERRGYGR